MDESWVHEVVKAIPKERVSERIVEQIVFEVVSLGASDHTGNHGDCAEAQEHIQERIDKQWVKTPVPPRMVEEAVEVVKILPRNAYRSAPSTDH